MSAQVEIGATSSAAPVGIRTLEDETRTGSHAGGYPLERIFDVVFSLAVVVLGAPVYAVLAIAVAVTSPGPVVYRQTVDVIGHNVPDGPH